MNECNLEAIKQTGITRGKKKRRIRQTIPWPYHAPPLESGAAFTSDSGSKHSMINAVFQFVFWQKLLKANSNKIMGLGKPNPSMSFTAEA